MSLTDQMETSRRARAAIEELIADPAQLGPDFQPVRRLDDERVVAWKATGRGKAGTDVGDTLSLLRGAQSLGLVERLDWAFRCHAFDVAVAHGVREELHLTPEPETFGSLCPPRLAGSFGRGRRELRVVAELHDDAFADESALATAVAEMRGWGWGFAVADLSAQPRLLPMLALVMPAYVEVDVTHGPDRPGVRTWVAGARELGAQLMAVGIDTAAARRAAQELDATCGRGTLLGPPADLP